MNCPYKWTNSIDEEDDQGSSWETEPNGERQENSRVWSHLMTRESGVGPEGTGSPDGEGGLIYEWHSTTFAEDDG